jgi:hypothetical protein
MGSNSARRTRRFGLCVEIMKPFLPKKAAASTSSQQAAAKRAM